MHVLLGLANSEDSVAGRALQRLGVTMAQVRESAETGSMTGRTGDDSAIDAEVLPGHSDDNGTDSLELGMDMAPRLRQIIRLAIDETMRAGRCCVGTGPILLGMLRADEAASARVLRTMGVTYDKARTQVNSVLLEGQVADD